MEEKEVGCLGRCSRGTEVVSVVVVDLAERRPLQGIEKQFPREGRAVCGPSFILMIQIYYRT